MPDNMRINANIPGAAARQQGATDGAGYSQGYGMAGGRPNVATPGLGSDEAYAQHQGYGQVPGAAVSQGYGAQAYGQPGASPQQRYGQVPGAQGAYAQVPYGQAAYAAMPPTGQAAYVPPQTSRPVQMPSNGPKKKRGRGFWIAIIIGIVCVVAAIACAIFLLQGGPSARQGAAGQLDGKTPEEIQEALDRYVEEGMFNISIASVVEFADGTSEGELRIENVPNNPYLMKVLITRDDTGEQLYESGIIDPDHHIQSDALDVDLDPGTYSCTATFLALDPESESEVGQAAAKVTIRVLG